MYVLILLNYDILALNDIKSEKSLLILIRFNKFHKYSLHAMLIRVKLIKS